MARSGNLRIRISAPDGLLLLITCCLDTVFPFLPGAVTQHFRLRLHL